MRHFRNILLVAVAIGCLGQATGPGAWAPDVSAVATLVVAPAHADDDDEEDGDVRYRGRIYRGEEDGDDNDDDDDDDGFVRRAAPPPPPPPPEFVVTAPTPADLDAIAAQGFEILSRTRLDLIDVEVARVRVPPGLSLEAARAQVTQIVTDATLDINHLYRPGEMPCSEETCTAYEMIGWTPRAQACELAPTIGMIDTSVNAGHAALADADIENFSAIGEGREPASALHGTAIAILLAGSNETRTPGLLPNARLIAVEAFHRDPRGEDAADAYDVVRAIETLVDRDVQVINLSFTGPANMLLKQVVDAARERDIALVAAAGNAGPNADPLYPAAYDGVVAVTAVDRGERVFSQANTGSYISFAAPGVRIWTAASISGGRFRSGTSYAAPLVSAVVAAKRALDPERPVADVVAEVADNAVDLGDPGRDDIYGWGLVHAVRACGDAGSAEADAREG